MNLKKIVSAAATAAITLSAAVTSFAANEITGTASTGTYTWNLPNVETTATAGTQLTGSSEYVNIIVSLGSGDSVTDNEISFANPSVKETDTSGYTKVGDTQRYILVSPKVDGTLSVTAQADRAGNSRHMRIYCGEVTADKTADSFQKPDSSTSSNTVVDLTSSRASTGTLSMTAGKTYILYTYNIESTVYDLTYSSEYITAPASVTFNEARQFEASEDYEGTATAVKFTVTPGDGTVTGIDVTYEGTKKSIETPTLTGDGTAVCGIVVGSVIDVTSENFSTVFDIDVR